MTYIPFIVLALAAIAAIWFCFTIRMEPGHYALRDYRVKFKPDLSQDTEFNGEPIVFTPV